MFMCSLALEEGEKALLRKAELLGNNNIALLIPYLEERTAQVVPV